MNTAIIIAIMIFAHILFTYVISDKLPAAKRTPKVEEKVVYQPNSIGVYLTLLVFGGCGIYTLYLALHSI